MKNDYKPFHSITSKMSLLTCGSQGVDVPPPLFLIIGLQVNLANRVCSLFYQHDKIGYFTLSSYWFNYLPKLTIKEYNLQNSQIQINLYVRT